MLWPYIWPIYVTWNALNMYQQRLGESEGERDLGREGEIQGERDAYIYGRYRQGQREEEILPVKYNNSNNGGYFLG